MAGWDALLEPLTTAPRENGTPALHHAAEFLRSTLEAAGLDVQLVPFSAEPYALRLAGVVALVGALLYARLIFARRFVASGLLAVLLPLALLLELDHVAPVFGWIGAASQDHVLARVPAQTAGERPEQRIVFVAHYDTKTDLLDHVERAPVDGLAAAVAPVLLLGALAGMGAARARRGAGALRWLARGSAVFAVVYGLATFAALSAGAFLPERSPGALDDGASCAALVRVAAALHASPLRRTEVEILLLSAEEVGVQGSWAYASQRYREPPDLPTAVVNLEGLGISARHAVLGSERFVLREYPPDARLRALLDPVHRELLGEPLAATPYGGATDARSFLAHGIPALTLITLPPGDGVPRGLHSSRDDRSRVDEAALDSSVAFLLAAARAIDERGLEGFQELAEAFASASPAARATVVEHEGASTRVSALRPPRLRAGGL